MSDITPKPQPEKSVVTLQVQHKYWVASNKGEKLFEVRQVRSDLLSCHYVNLQSLKTKEILTFEVGYRLPLKECNSWWAQAFTGNSADYMVIGLKPVDFVISLVSSNNKQEGEK